MTYGKKYICIQRYEYCSTNQHGDRHKQVRSKQVSSTIMTAKVGDANDITKLLILSDQLDVPVTYDFDASPQTASIEVVAKRNLP